MRKVRVILAEKNLPYEFLEENAWNADTTVPRYNPLCKVPALVMDDGESIYDSAVISEYLDAISGGGLVPAEAAARARVRRDEALGDGIADAGISAYRERMRDASRQDAASIARQMSKVNAGIEALAGRLGREPYLGGRALNLADIACACALFWAEFRMPELRWRDAHANLRGWAERMEARASFSATRPG